MVRKGSSVRVRQRAFRCARRSGATSPTSPLSFRAGAWPPAPGAARPNLNRSDTTVEAGRSRTAAQTDDRAAVGHVESRRAASGSRQIEARVVHRTASGISRERGGTRPALFILLLDCWGTLGQPAGPLGLRRSGRRGFHSAAPSTRVDDVRVVLEVCLLGVPEASGRSPGPRACSRSGTLRRGNGAGTYTRRHRRGGDGVPTA